MNEESYDFAVAGDSVFAAALSLALAVASKARVCLIGQVPAPLQIMRDMALSPGPFSRPETQDMIAAGTAGLRTLFAGTEPAVFERRDVTFAASSEKGRAAAGHVRHMLAAYGVITSLLPEGDGPSGFVAEGIWRLRPRAVHARLPALLETAGVAACRDIEDLQLGHDLVRFACAHAFVSARRLIVTDARYADALGPLPPGLVRQNRTALMTDPVHGLADRLLIDVETGAHVLGRADGRLEAVAPHGDPAAASDWLGTFLPGGAATRLIARHRFPVLVSRDGAPVIARVPHRPGLLAAGFGASAVFLAPALARLIAGTASAAEAGWFAARQADAGREAVADIGLVGGGAA